MRPQAIQRRVAERQQRHIFAITVIKTLAVFAVIAVFALTGLV